MPSELRRRGFRHPQGPGRRKSGRARQVKPGCKLHLVCDGHGLPLAVAVTAANVNDSEVFAALLDDVPRRSDALRPGTLPAGQGPCRQGG
jgi:hypothetical protein